MILAPHPPGQRADYVFIAHEGQTFKLLHELRLEGTEYFLALSIAPVDAAGKALRLPGGEPDVTRHTHHLSKTELSDPAFDLQARLRSLVAAKLNEIAARQQIDAFAARWLASDLTLGDPE